jgi:tetratricopeptide (TPR) repeat protein
MRSTLIRSWLILIGGICALLMGSISTLARDKAPAPSATPAVQEEDEADSDEAPAPEPEPEGAAESSNDDPPAVTETVMEDDATENSASDQDDQPEDAEPAPTPAAKQEGDAAAETKADEKDDADLPPPDMPDEPDTLPPPPPGGSLLEKIKGATTSLDRPEPAEFHGMRAGRSTVVDLEKGWGTPLNVTRKKEVVQRTYRLDEMGRVEVRCLRDIVQAISLHYDESPRWTDLAPALSMDNAETVEVKDEFGQLVGIAMPETGMLAVFKPGSSSRVADLVYEQIDAQAFTLRAEQRLGRDYAGCQRDLDLALVVDPQCARAHWLRARVLMAVGQIDAATKSAEAAVHLAPKNAQYRLTASALAADSGQFAMAIAETKQALTFSAAQPELKACALNQLGDQLAAGPDRDYKHGLAYHMQAIKLAEPLAHDRRTSVRQMAQEALVAAHLSAARNIAWGNWKMKMKMVPAWLNRAEELADANSTADDAAVDTRLRVYREALVACVGMEGDLDPTAWIEKAQALATPALAQATDPLRKRQLEWELGEALYDALQVYHASGDTHQAMKYGTLAVEHLEAGADGRLLEPVEAYLLGRLYYRMGAVCAMHVKDPEQAVVWFERAVPLLERPVPAAALADTGRHGESFVSMAVSYWAAGNRDEAMRLTRQGLKMMEQAVQDGTLEEEALRVPFTNLATMHKFLGDDEQAEAYGEMAAKASASRRQ